MDDVLIPLFIFILGLFFTKLSQYSSNYGEAYKLWIQEIVYGNFSINMNGELESINGCSETNNEKKKITKREIELFSKIEYLMIRIETLTDQIRILFISALFIFSVVMIINIYSIEVNSNGNSTIFSDIFVNKWNTPVITFIFVILAYSLIFFMANLFLKDLIGIDLFGNKTLDIQNKLFDIWYKHKCFDRRSQNFEVLRPRRFYEILAQKYVSNEKTFDGKKIEISEKLKEKLIHENLLRSVPY